MSTHKIFIDGAAGTTGLQVADRLASRDDIDLLILDDEARKDKSARLSAMQAADITILCLPDDAAKEAVLMADSTQSKVRLIDASTAHRVDPKFVYGFAEMAADQADQIARSDRISNPGCYPTGFIALVRPLVKAGLIAPSAGLVAACVSGYSGGGKSMITRYEDGQAPAFGNYGLSLQHKHLPEMKCYSGLEKAPVFLPSVGQFAQGMLVNILLHRDQFAQKITSQSITECYQKAYDNMPLISVSPENMLDDFGFLVAEALAQRDLMELMVFANSDESQFVLTARLDNLGKGASGAAVQNMNIMLGLEPLTSLNITS